MKVHGVQLDIAWEDPARNVRRIEQLLRENEPNPGDLVALPEMATSGFSMDVAAATSGFGQSVASIRALARELGVYMILGIAAPVSDATGANRAIVFDPKGNTAAEYTKMHPFSPGGESEPYPAGDTIATFPWNGLSVAPVICYDLRFPELFRAAVRRGAELFVVIANWPIARVDHWITLLRARAIENQAYVLGVNRCGRDPALRYPGRSLLVDPTGVVRCDAGDRECVLSGGVEPALAQDARRQLPFLRDMRADFDRW